MSLSTTVKFLQDMAFSKSVVSNEPQEMRKFQKIADLVGMLCPDSKITPIGENVDENLLDGTPSIWFMNHNDPTSWMPMVPLVCKKFIDAVNEHNTKGYPFIFFHKIVLNTPVVKEVVKKFAGNSLGSYEDLIRVLESNGPYHMATCPEGANCMYDYGGPVADFQQFAMIKAALTTGTKIFVLTFKHRHPLSVSVKVPFLQQIVKNAKGVKIPYFWLMKNPINAVYEILDPGITKQEFNSLTKQQQNEVVQVVGKKIKDRFELRFAELPAP
jgi:hypothetical protein